MFQTFQNGKTLNFSIHLLDLEGVGILSFLLKNSHIFHSNKKACITLVPENNLLGIKDNN